MLISDSTYFILIFASISVFSIIALTHIRGYYLFRKALKESEATIKKFEEGKINVYNESLGKTISVKGNEAICIMHISDASGHRFRNYPDSVSETSGHHNGTSGHLVELI